MSKFIMLGKDYVNMDMVAKAHKVNGEFAKVLLKDGAEHIVHSIALDFMSESDKIVQVIPVAVPTFVLFETEDTAAEKEIHYLGLTETGDVRPLILTGDCYEFADDSEDYLGMYEYQS